MLRPTAEQLNELNVPNNAFVRIAYRTIYTPLYYTLYSGLTIVAFAKCKSRVEVLNSMSQKLFGEDAIPAK